MSYRIIFLGLATFFELKPRGRLVLLPDGRRAPATIDPASKIAPHHAALYVKKNNVLNGFSWWSSIEDQVLASYGIRQFPVPTPSTLTISGVESAPSGEPDHGFDDENFDANSIKLRDIDSNIRIVPEKAATIAQIPIRRGTLSSRMLKSAIVAQLEVPSHKGPITVTANPADKSAPRKLTLAAATEIVIANVSRNLHAHSGDPEASHFRLYAQLDSDRRVGRLEEPDLSAVAAMNIPALESTHPYIKHLLNLGAVPGTQCSVTGCC